MPQFIGRPNLPNIPVPVIPSKDEQIYNALSGLLNKFTEHNLDISKQREQLASRKDMLKFVQDSLDLRQKEENLAGTIKGLLGKGYTLESAGMAEGPLAQGQSPAAMLTGQPKGAINIGELQRLLGATEKPESFRKQLVPPSEDVVKKQSKEADLRIKKARLAALGKDKGKGLSELIRLRGQFVGQLNNLATEAPEREGLQTRIADIDASLGQAGLPGFNDEMILDLRDARKAVRLGKIDEAKAQEMLSSKYPGLSQVFSKKDKGFFKTLLEAAGIGGD